MGHCDVIMGRSSTERVSHIERELPVVNVFQIHSLLTPGARFEKAFVDDIFSGVQISICYVYIVFIFDSY